MKRPSLLLFCAIFLSTVLFACDKTAAEPPIDNPTDNDTVVVPEKPAVGSYQRLPDAVDCGGLVQNRRIWVYLPPNYDVDTTKHYPVCYMHDGQNIFENGGYGSWSMHAMLNRRFADGKEVGIVVAIDNTSERMSEYTPFANERYAPNPKGDAYLEAIVTKIMPYVNSHYRTLTGREQTMLCGSSLGGLISYYGGLKADSVFGRIGAVSPSFWYCYDALEAYTAAWQPRFPTKFYLICGDDESQSTVPDMQAFYQAMLSRGIAPEAIQYEVVVGGKHNEASWARQIGRVYDFLFE